MSVFVIVFFMLMYGWFVLNEQTLRERVIALVVLLLHAPALVYLLFYSQQI